VDVAFIGLGIMGMPMAVNLADHGHDVRAYARRESVRQSARAKGLTTSDSIAGAVRGAEIVITMLTDGAAVRDVVMSDEGVLESIDSGAVYVDMSTIAPSDWQSVLDSSRALGLAAVDAPVSGGEQAAIEGTLSIMAGGAHEVIERVRSTLESIGVVVRVGDEGSGQVVKAANQLVVAGNIQLLSEALVLLDKTGVELPTALDVLSRGLAGSTVLTRKRDAFLERTYEPGFTLNLHAKDMGIVTDVARALRLSLPLTAAVTQLVNSAVATGRGNRDHSALHDLARESNGLPS